MKPLVLQDGTEVRAGDIVRAKGEATGWRKCTVLWVERGGRNGMAVLTANTPFGTVPRRASEIKPYVRGSRNGRIEGTPDGAMEVVLAPSRSDIAVTGGGVSYHVRRSFAVHEE